MRAWALAIWEMTAPPGPGIQVTAPLLEAVPEGDEVAFLVAHYEYGIVEGTFELFPAELSEDRMTLRTPNDEGLERTTMWMAVRRTP